MNIADLKDGMRKVDVAGTVTDKTETREVKSRYTNDSYRVADATLEDVTGHITLTLWNEQTEKVLKFDKVKVENGYIKSFKDVLQLNSGKYGTLTVL